MRFRTWTIKTIAAGAGVLSLAVLGIVMLGGLVKAPAGSANHGMPPGGLPVPVATVVKKPLPLDLDYVGTAEAIRSVTLQAKVTGYLAIQGAPDGADVKAGDLLYRIDPRDYQAALEQAKAQALRDAAQVEYAQANTQRSEALNKIGSVSLDAYQQAASSLHQYQAAVAVDRAAIEAAQLNVGYTEIRAPFAGRLSRSQVHEGAVISAAGTNLNSLVQLDPIYVTFNPPETDLRQIQRAQSQGTVGADVTVGDDPNLRLSGKLAFLDNTVDRSTGTITARIILANPQARLLPGQFVRVRLHLGQQSEAILLPQAAVGSNQFGRFVYVVGQDRRAELRIVTLGRTDGELVSVENGVAQTDSIIVGNLQKLRPGVPVMPLAAPPATGAAEKSSG